MEKIVTLVIRRLTKTNLVSMFNVKRGCPSRLKKESPLEEVLFVVLLLLFGGAGSPNSVNMVSIMISIMLTITHTAWALPRNRAPVVLKLDLFDVMAALRTRLRTSGLMTPLMLPKSRVTPTWNDLFPLLFSPATHGP